jgi:hypothetical protein
MRTAEGLFLPGTANPRAVLREEDIRIIRDAIRTSTLSQRKLARQYKVARATIWAIAHDITWVHVP